MAFKTYDLGNDWTVSHFEIGTDKEHMIFADACTKDSIVLERDSINRLRDIFAKCDGKAA